MSVASCQLPVISQHQSHVMSFRQHQRHVIPGNIEKKELFFNVDPESIQPVVGCQFPKPCQHQRHVIPGQPQRHVIPGNIEKKELFFNVDRNPEQPIVGCQLPVASYQSAPKPCSASAPCHSGAISLSCHSGNISAMSFRQPQRHVIPGNIEKKELFFNVDPESIQPVVGCQLPVASYQSAPKAMFSISAVSFRAISLSCHSGNLSAMSFRATLKKRNFFSMLTRNPFSRLSVASFRLPVISQHVSTSASTPRHSGQHQKKELFFNVDPESIAWIP
ncbi:hypothetical protein QUF72_01305 [Desulfobacterales bacterium HSG2]|nr:hypothetical protein [Desulfobacterales bacterium HSG2]